MGKKDIRTVDYLSDKVYFADMFNVSCFQGKRVILSNQLEDTDKELKDPETEKGEEVRHDSVKYWKHGARLATLVVEDQYNIDYHMVLRNLYAEGLYYRNQWKKKKSEHLRAKDLKAGHEFISGMKKEEKFVPVVYLVVYLGKEKWEGPRTLHELLDFDGENEQLKQLINDYKLNIFDYHDYNDFENFESELRVVFEFLRYSDDKEALRKVVATHSEKYYNVSNETYQIIAMLTNSEELLMNNSNSKNDGGRNQNNMCKALQDIKDEGLSEGLEIGRNEGITAFISACRDFGVAREEILGKLVEKFSLEAVKAEEYMKKYWKEV